MMSLSTLKPVACRISPVNVVNEARLPASKVSMVKRSQEALARLQVKASLQESFKSASRREMMQLTAASLGLVLLPASAHATEVYTKDANIMQKVIEEFQEILKKAGSMKPEDEAHEKKPDTEGKVEAEKQAAPAAPPTAKPSAPALPSIINGDKTVEKDLH